jgi:hypothetical protein
MGDTTDWESLPNGDLMSLGSGLRLGLGHSCPTCELYDGPQVA